MDKLKKIPKVLLSLLVGGMVCITPLCAILLVSYFKLGEFVLLLMSLLPAIMISYCIGDEILYRYGRKDEL